MIVPSAAHKKGYALIVVPKDKGALFNVTYNVTDIIKSQANLLHNNILNRYLHALLYLPSTTPFNASFSKGDASIIFSTFGMVQPCDSNPHPPAPKADTLLTLAIKVCGGSRGATGGPDLNCVSPY